MFWPNSEKQPWCSKYGLKKREKKKYLNDFFCHGLYIYIFLKKTCLQVNPKFVQLIFNSCNFLTGFFFFDYIILILSNLFFKKNKPMKNSLSNENLCYFFIFYFFLGIWWWCSNLALGIIVGVASESQVLLLWRFVTRYSIYMITVNTLNKRSLKKIVCVKFYHEVVERIIGKPFFFVSFLKSRETIFM